MRPLLTSIGPLLPDIRAASGMSYTLVALLTALPVIAMGVLALAGWLGRSHIGQNAVLR
jgi:CP family cyanate transporter-like MFS transporter